MNMLFNTEKPRFDSHLQSARLHPQRAAARQSRWRPQHSSPRAAPVGCRHFDFGGSRGAYAPAGRERLGSRFLKAPGQAVAAPARRRARNHAQPARMSPSVPFWLFD
jgi:hypothetical protein